MEGKLLILHCVFDVFLTFGHFQAEASDHLDTPTLINDPADQVSTDIFDNWRQTAGGARENSLAGWKTGALIVSIDIDAVAKKGKQLNRLFGVKKEEPLIKGFDFGHIVDRRLKLVAGYFDCIIEKAK